MFTNEIVSENCNCKVEKDRKVHVPGIYSGLLSNITPKAAARMLKTKSNLIDLKEGKTLPADGDKIEESLTELPKSSDLSSSSGPGGASEDDLPAKKRLKKQE